MTNVKPREHWDQVYLSKSPADVSWFQPQAKLSLGLIRRAAPDLSAPIIDVGGGASTLVDGLLDAGYSDVTVLDISRAALALARERLGARAQSVKWIEADILAHPLPRSAYAVWHDRAVFHFLITEPDRHRYVAQVRASVRDDGHVIVASFAPDGPEKCSGLEVMRYSPESMHEEFGDGFRLLESVRETHVTPSGGKQAFVYCMCRVVPESATAAREV